MGAPDDDRRHATPGTGLCVVAGIGRTLIAAGVLLLLFVAYQLYGTGLRTAQAQDRLDDEFAERLEQVPTAPTTTSTTTATTTPTVPGAPAGDPTTTETLPASTVPPLPPEALPQEGQAAGRIVIPRIGVDWTFVEGVSVADLKLGPGHYPQTPLPGQAGNAAIAGHRTTYGAPFHDLDQLVPGDEITVDTLQGSFRYRVVTEPAAEPGAGHFIVAPSQVEVLDDMGDDRLTLTACHPKYSARQRIVVVAELVGEPAPATPAPAPVEAEPEPAPLTLDGDVEEEFDPWPAVLWGLACAAIWALAWFVGRRRPGVRWPAYAVGLVPFVPALYLCFESVALLLPSNY